jgi:hypothetical protein
MDRETFSKVWTIVHLFAIYTGVNALLVVQNSPMLLPLVVTAREEALRGPDSMAVYWFLISAPALCLSMLLAIIFLKRQPPGTPVELRVPTMFAISLIPRDNVARAYQLFWIVLCTLASGYGVCHAGKTVLEATIYVCDQDEQSLASAKVRFDQSMFRGMLPNFGFDKARFDGCRARQTADATKSGSPPLTSIWLHRGIEYVPVLHDLLVATFGMTAAGLALLLWGLWQPWLPPPPRRRREY